MIDETEEKAWNQEALWHVRVVANRDFDRYYKSLTTNRVAIRKEAQRMKAIQDWRDDLDRQGIIMMDGPGGYQDFFDKKDEFYLKKMAEYVKNLTKPSLKKRNKSKTWKKLV